MTLKNANDSATAGLYMVDTYEHARAVWECADGLDFIPDKVKYEWGDNCTGCTSLAKGAAAEEFQITVRCCTSGD